MPHHQETAFSTPTVEDRAFVAATDRLLERLEQLALDGVRRLPQEEARRMAEMLAQAGKDERPPKRVTLAHRQVLALQERVLPVALCNLQRWGDTRGTGLHVPSKFAMVLGAAPQPPVPPDRRTERNGSSMPPLQT